MRFGGNTSYCLTSYRLVNRGPRGNDCINGTVPYITVMIATKPRKRTVWTIWQMQTMRIWLKKVFMPRSMVCSRDLQWHCIDRSLFCDTMWASMLCLGWLTVLTGPYFVTPCEHQCSALCGWLYWLVPTLWHHVSINALPCVADCIDWSLLCDTMWASMLCLVWLTVLTGPYFVTPCEHQCSALCGWLYWLVPTLWHHVSINALPCVADHCTASVPVACIDMLKR